MVGAGRGVVVVVVVAGSLNAASGCIRCVDFSWRRLVVRRFGQNCCRKFEPDLTHQGIDLVRCEANGGKLSCNVVKIAVVLGPWWHVWKTWVAG